jgi:hypothetical protein
MQNLKSQTTAEKESLQQKIVELQSDLKFRLEKISSLEITNA